MFRPFRLLDGVPRQDDVRDGCGKGVLQGAVGVEDMRVAADHLRREAPGDVVERESVPLLGEPGVEDHLQQNVAQFALEV